MGLNTTKYVFPSAYGGAVESDEPPQIHAKLKDLRFAVTLEAKKAPGVMFPVKSAKELNQKLAQALSDLNMVASPIKQEVTFFDTDKVPVNLRQNGNPVFRTLAHVTTTVRIIAPDTSFIDVVGSGHGGDVDDKAGGKASTFSWKDAILKGLTVPSEDMVDTDDDSTVGDTPVTRTFSRGNNQVSEPPAASPADLAYVEAQIAKAESEADLEVIRKAIKDGTLDLHGQDKLKASKSFSAKMEEIKKGKKG